jgi:hypothetical protein
MRVRVGQKVVWKGDLASHPMSFKLVNTTGGAGDASAQAVIGDPDGGATENTVQADAPMGILFSCTRHPTAMLGAVDVVP